MVIGEVGAARADIAPADSCTSPGQPCQNAGAVYNAPGQPGTCVASTCTKSIRSADGGLTPISYACNLCKATGDGGTSAAGGSGGIGGSSSATGGTGGSSSATGGTGGGASATGGTSGPAGTGGSSVHTGGGSSGCSVVPGRSSDEALGLLAAAVAIGLAARLRRRHAV
ncbi:MAG TPA: hypothetical protein VMT03_03085 [Polyangia bacterium]|nr:hypothetical protein [Polyangia bacterium]